MPPPPGWEKLELGSLQSRHVATFGTSFGVRIMLRISPHPLLPHPKFKVGFRHIVTFGTTFRIRVMLRTPPPPPQLKVGFRVRVTLELGDVPPSIPGRDIWWKVAVLQVRYVINALLKGWEMSQQVQYVTGTAQRLEMSQ